MEDVAMNELVETEVQEDLSLEGLNAKTERIIEGMNHMYDSLRQYVHELKMRDDQVIGQGFNQIGMAITGINATLDYLLDQMVEKLGVNKDEALKAITSKVEDLVKAQFEMIKKAQAEAKKAPTELVQE